MDDRRRIDWMRVTLTGIALESKDPGSRAAAKSVLDATRDLPKKRERNAYCKKHKWFGVSKEKCPICHPKTDKR